MVTVSAEAPPSGRLPQAATTAGKLRAANPGQAAAKQSKQARPVFVVTVCGCSFPARVSVISYYCGSGRYVPPTYSPCAIHPPPSTPPSSSPPSAAVSCRSSSWLKLATSVRRLLSAVCLLSASLATAVVRSLAAGRCPLSLVTVRLPGWPMPAFACLPLHACLCARLPACLWMPGPSCLPACLLLAFGW